MRATPICAGELQNQDPSQFPRFWRTKYADLIKLWGEDGARQMLRAMERAYQQEPPELIPRKRDFERAGCN